ncbi:MAG: sugar transferase [bacterium]
MSKIHEKILLLLCDFIVINTTFIAWAWLRKELGFFSESRFPTLLLISAVVYSFWFLIFSFFGLYSLPHPRSRLDEVITTFKSVTFGVFIIFLLTFDIERDFSQPPRLSRMFILNYWLILFSAVSFMRVLLRSFQKSLLAAGIGHRRTLIVGWNDKSRALSERILRFPALGYRVVGFVAENPPGSRVIQEDGAIPLLGHIDQLEAIVEKVKAQEVILAVEPQSRNSVMDVFSMSNGLPVNFKIVPDLYDIVVGQARTNQIYGFPLIDILPDFMPEWERKMKRLIDILISTLILAAFLPFWILIALLIKLDSKGPVFYKQKRVGKDEKEFTIYKFRSMIHNAESQTGPRWADREDSRITLIGSLLRKPRLDEIPQFLNVLKGEMSLVGPRPERPYFVKQLKKQIPFYSRRMRVKPGITGWAQIKGAYDASIENVKAKLQYDLFYLENMSLRMDLKIIVNTLYVMLMGKGH